MPPATYRVIGGRATRVHGFAPSIVAVGERFEISVRSEDRYYNRATSGSPAYEVLLNGQRFASLEAGRAIHALPVTLEREGVYRFTFRSPDGRIEGAANPVWARTAPGPRIYWGETHGHCGFAEGQGTPEGYFEFARDDACLDFVTLSEHDIWLTDGEWRYLNEVAERFHRDGELAVYAGYEWTAPRQRGGHHNVLFRRPGMKRVGVQMAPNLSELYRGLRAVHDPSEVLIIPHAHQASDWRQSDYDLENLVEIMSSHGTFEWFGQRYLEHGHRVGFVGASDDHLGHPGYAPGHPASPTRRSNIFQFGGLVGVVSNRGDSNAIFDALKARSAYATTGSQRIILEARLNGHNMGTAQKQRKERKVVGRVIGTQPIRTISLIKNSKVVDRFDLGRPSGGESGTLEVLVGFYSESKVHIRDNPRGHHTWRGALTVSGAQLSSAWFLGTPNTTADRLERDGNRIVFDVATRGAGRTLALRLRGATETTRFRFDLQATREMGTAPRQVRAADRFPAEGFVLILPQGAETSEKTFATDYHKDCVTVERLRRRSDFEFQFTDRGRPGDWYYVRVEQTDGHLAWTSPWWVGGERPR